MISLDLIVFAALGLTISFYDSRQFIIPDIFIIFGVVFLTFLTFTSPLTPLSVLLGIITGAGQMTLVRVITGDSLGWGDVKYSGLLAGWLGAFSWLFAGLFAAFFALLIFLPALVGKKIQRNTKIPFAPFLTCGALTTKIISEIIK